MSQNAAILSLLRTSYVRLLPNMRAAGTIFLTTAMGSLLLGPVGAIPGAAGGAATVLWIDRIIEFFHTLLSFVGGNPVVVGMITAFISYICSFFRRNRNQPLEFPPHFMGNNE